MIWYYALALGAGGAGLRGLLGIRKKMETPEFKIEWLKLGVSIGIGAGMGLVSILLPGSSNLLAFTSGYLGDDGIQGLMTNVGKK